MLNDKMGVYKRYRSFRYAELRPVTEDDIESYNRLGFIYCDDGSGNHVSISDYDRHNGGPKIGDMIRRNTEVITDQWLVSEDYFRHNFELLE